MKQTSQIAGVNITPLREIKDERGAVLHMLRSDSPDFVKFGECYFSEVLPGVVKGWKRHKLQTQNLSVPVGNVLMVIYDNRENSPTKGLVEEIYLGRPDTYIRLTIAPGLWYAFACLSATPSLVVNCADIPFAPDESEMFPLNDKMFPYEWDLSKKKIQ